jgi:hypothetical protein
MDNQGETTQPISPRRSRRSRTLPGFIFVLGCIVGIALGIAGSIWYVAANADRTFPAPVASHPGEVAVTVIVSKAHFTQIATREAVNAQVPGTLSNIQVNMQRNQPITLTGNDQLSLLGLAMTRSFTVRMVPYVHACQLQWQVQHVDLAGVPVPSIGSTLQQQLNQEPLLNSSALSKNFTYCVTNAYPVNDGLVIILSAQAIQS